MLRALRPLARQTAVPRALPSARRWATTVNGEEHHSPSEVAPPPPPGVPVDPQRASETASVSVANATDRRPTRAEEKY